MTTIEIAFLVVTCLYFLQGILLLVGLARTRYAADAMHEPMVSIVVAARNEEHNIGTCIASLAEIEYPKDKLEVIIVDDQSTDATSRIVTEAACRHPFLRLVHATPSTGGIHGKANALAQGIDHATGEIVMMTDADCTAHPQWVRKTVRYFSPSVGIIAGFTLLDVRGWFSGLQSLDLAYILGLGAAAIGLRLPLSCIGNNFSFRRKAYDEVGGYRGVPFSVTEDFALFKAIIRSGRWDYRFPMETETLITSKPCERWIDLYRQKRRWAVGGKEIQFHGVFLFIIGFAVHAGIALQLTVPSLMSWSIFAAGIAIKIAADYLFLSGVLARTNHRSHLRYFFLFELYFLLYVGLLPLIVFLGGKVVWKERKF
ncbi:MAG TPA: glycosyltransferase [Bacteroidota bacterium]|nr:glycosyltransferase [Bacteroidota bacterium]